MVKRPGGEPIGMGSEKDVYPDPIDPEHKVVAFLKADSRHNATPIQIRARYYFAKIAHILFPKNIPDIHLAATKEEPHLRLTKIELENIEIELANIFMKIVKASQQKKQVPPSLQQEFYERVRTKERDPNIPRLVDQIQSAGIEVDSLATNFAYDKKGNLQYIDNSQPFTLYSDGLIGRVYFNPARLKQTIEAIEDPATRERATSYLKRLIDLYEKQKIHHNE